jgi:phosphoribosyl-AMP cyclohydrolase / phosphoribosyl-ATP pyrophosphohydrolase
MIIPSIDIQSGQVVQLIGGEMQAIVAGDPRPIAKKFSLVGEVALIDLDAARTNEHTSGNNAALLQELLPLASFRVGGGIRSCEQAIDWLDRGASKIILGTAASKELLLALPKERTIVALDARHGEIFVEGWRRATGTQVIDRMRELAPYTGGFLVTLIEREGRMVGTDFSVVEQLLEAAGDAKLTIAGGISSAEEIAKLDQIGVDAQVGMALYTGRFDLSDVLAALLRSDRSDGLWPTVVTDEHGVALGLVYSNKESLQQAVEQQQGYYFSRRRGLWRKGETSGNVQELIRIDLDCDRDTLRFTVRQHGSGFCHTNTETCWGNQSGLQALERRIQERSAVMTEGSYTSKLLSSPNLLASKLQEEAGELAVAKDREAVLEAADLLYFMMVALRKQNVRLAEVERELDRRMLKLTRRPGLAKVTKEMPHA